MFSSCHFIFIKLFYQLCDKIAELATGQSLLSPTPAFKFFKVKPLEEAITIQYKLIKIKKTTIFFRK